MPTVTVTGGEKLKLKIKELEKVKIGLKVGVLEGATYPDGMNVATVAYLNEYGTHNPPRPFLKTTVDKQHKKWIKGVRNNLTKMGVTPQSLKTVFEMLGQTAQGDIKRTISEWSPTDPRPNKPATIAAKARRARAGKGTVGIDPNRVLIDTGRMIQSIDYEVIT